MLGQFSTPVHIEDAEFAIRDTFASLERAGEQKERIVSKRDWRLFISVMTITLALTMKCLLLSAGFLFIAVIAMCVFAKAHKAARLWSSKSRQTKTSWWNCTR